MKSSGSKVYYITKWEGHSYLMRLDVPRYITHGSNNLIAYCRQYLKEKSIMGYQISTTPPYLTNEGLVYKGYCYAKATKVGRKYWMLC